MQTVELNLSIDILIPAYKIDFLEHTLDCFINAHKYSDAVQIIVFCDGENPKIDKLVHNYPKYKYIKFSENLGSRSLVAHWMRCIEYSNSDYIWLFSDDDTIIETELISLLSFFESNKNNKVCYRLRVDRINQFGIKTRAESNKILPKDTNLDGFDLLAPKLNGFIDNVIPNFIFHKNILKSGIKLKEFDLAWMSDDLFWFDIANEFRITQLNLHINWRVSGVNISANKQQVHRKLIPITIGTFYLLKNAIISCKFIFIMNLLKWYAKSLKGLL